MTHHHEHNTLYLKIGSLNALFDDRDPESLPLRRLNPEWLEYVFDMMNDMPGNGKVHLSLQTNQDILGAWKVETLAMSLHEHLKDHDELLRRRLKGNFQKGRSALGVGLITLVIFTALSEATTLLYLGIFQQVLEEGFLIFGWVALWRPIEILLYDWWPIAEDRKKIKRLLAGHIKVHTEPHSFIRS